MLKVRRSELGVASGQESLFSDFECDGAMWAGDGMREIRKHVNFPEPFRTVPQVHVSLALVDFDQTTNVRAHVYADNVAPRSFDVVFRTWANTRVARVNVSWFAIGELADPDDWNV